MTLDLGPFTFEVESRPGLSSDGQLLNGLIEHNQCKIAINPDSNEQVKYVTVWHEIIHAILAFGPHKVSEGTIETLSLGVVEALRRNPFMSSMEAFLEEFSK